MSCAEFISLKMKFLICCNCFISNVSHTDSCVLSVQTCCGCSLMPCTMKTLSKKRPSTNGSQARTLQSKQAKVWPWNRLPLSSPGSARPRRSLTRSKILKWKLLLSLLARSGLCRQLWRVEDNIAREADSNQSSVRINLYFIFFLWEMDSENNHFSLPSLSCFLIISPPACHSKCPHQINLKTDSAGLLVNEVWSIPHHYKTFFVAVIRTDRLLLFMVLGNYKARHPICPARINCRACGVVSSPICGYHAITCVQSNRALLCLCPLLECAAWLKCVSINATVDEPLTDKCTWTNLNLMEFLKQRLSIFSSCFLSWNCRGQKCGELMLTFDLDY